MLGIPDWAISVACEMAGYDELWEVPESLVNEVLDEAIILAEDDEWQ